MPEYYKKVVASQFLLTDEQKAELEKGGSVSFDGQPIKRTAPGHYHVLVPVEDQLKPMHQGDWIVRHPEVEIKRDFEFRTQFVAAEGFDAAETAQKLEAFMRERNQISI